MSQKNREVLGFGVRQSWTPEQAEHSAMWSQAFMMVSSPDDETHLLGRLQGSQTMCDAQDLVGSQEIVGDLGSERGSMDQLEKVGCWETCVQSLGPCHSSF